VREEALLAASQHDSLRGQSVRLLSLLLGDEQKKDIYEIFDLLDRDQRGVITFGVRRGWRGFFPQWKS
jgi:Ca2+-binding EF-hand superfamily protein